MTGYEFCFSYWWIFPLVMVIFCFFFMKRGSGKMMCGFSANNDNKVESALEILNKRFAKGEIDQREYEEMKSKFSGQKTDN